MKTLRLTYWVLLSLFAEFLYDRDLDWCWFANYAIGGLAGATFFNFKDGCFNVYRIGPFMHTDSGWYYKYKRISNNIVAPFW